MTAIIPAFALTLVLKVTMIFAFGMLALMLTRRTVAAELRHVLLYALIVSVLVLPVVLVAVPSWDMAILPAASSQVAVPRVLDVGDATPVPPAPRIADPAARLHAVTPSVHAPVLRVGFATPMAISIPVALWAFGSIMVLGYLMLGAWRLRRIARRASPVDAPEWLSLLDEERVRAGIRAPVALLISRAATSPVTWGLRAPFVLLPEDATEWMDDRRRVVLRHELAHVSRSDALAQLIANVACAAYWFHPLAWITARRLCIECELACDDRVLSSGIAADRYAAHLLDVARAARGMGGPGFVSLAMAQTSRLESRLRGVLEGSRRRLVLRRRSRDGIVAVTAAALLAFSACRAVIRGGNGGPVVGVNSVVNGIATVQHSADAFARATQLSVDSAPIAVMHGAAGGDEDLRFVAQVLELSDGRYAVSRAVNPRVMIFRPDGTAERTIGPYGRGPDNLFRPGPMYALGGDTIFVQDWVNLRAVWMLPDKGFVRTAPLPDFRGQFSGLSVPGLLPDRRFVTTHESYPNDTTSGVRRYQISIAVGSMLFDGMQFVDSFPGREQVGVLDRYGPTPRVAPVPLALGRLSYIAVWDSLIALATGEHGYEIERHDTAGHLVGRVRVDIPRRPVTQAMRDAELRRRLRPFTALLDKRFTERPLNAQETERRIRATPFADSLPPYGQIFVTKRKNLWVVDGASPSDTGWSATAFRVDGAIIARLHSPYGREPIYMGDDRVVVNVPDSNGAYSLRVYRLSRSLAAPVRLGAAR